MVLEITNELFWAITVSGNTFKLPSVENWVVRTLQKEINAI